MCGEFPLAEQIRLVLTDVLRTELVGRTLEVTREIFDGLEVDAGCSLGVITTLEFLEHHFTKVGHRSSPYAPTLSLHLLYSTAANTGHAKASAAKRLRSNRLLGSVGSVRTFVADAAPGLAHDIIINEECVLLLRWRRLATRESPRTAAEPIHSCAGPRCQRSINGDVGKAIEAFALLIAVQGITASGYRHPSPKMICGQRLAIVVKSHDQTT